MMEDLGSLAIGLFVLGLNLMYKCWPVVLGGVVMVVVLIGLRLTARDKDE